MHSVCVYLLWVEEINGWLGQHADESDFRKRCPADEIDFWIAKLYEREWSCVHSLLFWMTALQSIEVLKVTDIYALMIDEIDLILCII